MDYGMLVIGATLIVVNAIGILVQFRKRTADGTLSKISRGYIYVHLGFILPLLAWTVPVIRDDEVSSLVCVIVGFALAFFGFFRIYIEGRDRSAGRAQ
jgi:uncharacterized membrane protein HdeD (DUF308 family)